MKLGVMTLIWILWFLILVCSNNQILNQNLKWKIIFLHGPNRHSPPQEITLEIRMIQGEPGLISKEQVLHSLVMIIWCPKLDILWLVQIQTPTTMLGRIRDGKLPWMKRWILFRKKQHLGTSFSSFGEEIGSMQVGVSDKGWCLWKHLKI